MLQVNFETVPAFCGVWWMALCLQTQPFHLNPLAFPLPVVARLFALRLFTLLVSRRLLSRRSRQRRLRRLVETPRFQLVLANFLTALWGVALASDAAVALAGVTRHRLTPPWSGPSTRLVTSSIQIPMTSFRQ